MPSTARKSQKQVGKFGALTTKDANRQIAKRKNKEYEASVRKAGRTAPLGLPSTPTRALGEGNGPLTPIDIAQAANHYYHKSFPRQIMCFIAANRFKTIVGYGKIVGIGGPTPQVWVAHGTIISHTICLLIGPRLFFAL